MWAVPPRDLDVGPPSHIELVVSLLPEMFCLKLGSPILSAFRGG
jgi:hypothetical protein